MALFVALPLFVWSITTQNFDIRKKAEFVNYPKEICWNQVHSSNNVLNWPDGCRGRYIEGISCTQAFTPLSQTEKSYYSAWITDGMPLVAGCAPGCPTFTPPVCSNNREPVPGGVSENGCLLPPVCPTPGSTAKATATSKAKATLKASSSPTATPSATLSPEPIPVMETTPLPSPSPTPATSQAITPIVYIGVTIVLMIISAAFIITRSLIGKTPAPYVGEVKPPLPESKTPLN